MALPVELTFKDGDEFSEARLSVAMEYIVARFRAIESIHPEFQSVIDELKGVGLVRVTEALTPIFEEAQGIADALEAIKAQWQQDATIEEVKTQVTEAVTVEFAEYRHRYLGAFPEAPTVNDEGSPVGVGAMYFDTTLDSMRVLGQSGWKDAGSSVAGVMEQLDPIIATAGQTTFPIPGGYEAGYLIVTVNGIVIPSTDYTATNGTTLAFAVGLSAGDEVAGVKFGSVTLATVYNKSQSDARYRLIADSYTKGEVDAVVGALVTGKANVSDVYTKPQSDGRYANLSLSNLPDAAAARNNIGAISASQTATLTNKRIQPRVNAQSTIASPWAWNSDSHDAQEVTALDGALTINADAGTPLNFEETFLRFKASGADRVVTLTGGVAKGFRDLTGMLTASGGNWTYTVPNGKTVYFGMIYNANNSRWDIVGMTAEG